MKINRAYKFRLYPDDTQKEIINKTIGCTRLVYNTMLSKKKENNLLKMYDLLKEIPNMYIEYPFLKEVDSNSLRNAVFNLEDAYKKCKKDEYPKFRIKGRNDKYKISYYNENIKLDMKNKTITLPKLGTIKIKGYRHVTELDVKIINATIEHIANKYYVSLCVEEDIVQVKSNTQHVVGIDVGVKSLITTSDGEYYGNPNYLKKYERKIKGLQKGLSRKVKGSKNYYKAKIKLAEAYRKLKNARQKTNEEIVSKIIKSNDIIVTEDLSVKDMIENTNNKSLRKNILNSTMSDIIRRLKYKCYWLNKKFIQVDKYYASSQLCSCCGHQNTKMKDINIREYHCSVCGIELDRDLNASINIMYEGIIESYKCYI